MRRLVGIRLSEEERRLVAQLQVPGRGRERGLSATLRQLVYEEAARRGLWPPREQAKEARR